QLAGCSARPDGPQRPIDDVGRDALVGAREVDDRHVAGLDEVLDVDVLEAPDGVVLQDFHVLDGPRGAGPHVVVAVRRRGHRQPLLQLGRAVVDAVLLELAAAGLDGAADVGRARWHAGQLRYFVR